MIKDLIDKLKKLGYEIKLKPGREIKLKLKEGFSPDPEEVNPLLEKLKSNKPEVIKILRNTEMINSNSNWYVIKSNLLGEKIILKREQNTQIPDKYRELPVYTFLEGELLLNRGTDTQKLKDLHKAQKELNGTIILGDLEVLKK